MATTQGQDIIRCQLCANPTESHCNVCQVNLCFTCIPKHMRDKTTNHEIVDFINRKEKPVLPACKSHERKVCEMYCNDCHEPICVLCVADAHKKHDITDIWSIMEMFQQRIIVDLKELENEIVPKYENVDRDSPLMEFDKLMNVIQDKEDNICQIVREIGSDLKDEVSGKKKDSERESKDIYLMGEEGRAEINKIIQNIKSILQLQDAANILNYQCKNDKYRHGPKQAECSCPSFLSGEIRRKDIQEMFGFLQHQSKTTSERELGQLNMLSVPVIVSRIERRNPRNAKLWRILCEGAERFWTGENDNKIYRSDRTGLVLVTINAPHYVLGMSFNIEKELIFFVAWQDTKVYKYASNEVMTLLELNYWCPRGLCHSRNGDLLVSMRSVDITQSRIVRYTGKTETKVIQNDSKGTPLFSVGEKKVLLLTENGNGDICVADFAGECVVVLHASGELRFTYRGNSNSKYNTFKPLQIVTDIIDQILINDELNNIIHVIDRDGNFLRYIEFPCNGGLSVDTDHNLVVGEVDTGIIRIIKYLE